MIAFIKYLLNCFRTVKYRVVKYSHKKFRPLEVFNFLSKDAELSKAAELARQLVSEELEKKVKTRIVFHDTYETYFKVAGRGALYSLGVSKISPLAKNEVHLSPVTTRFIKIGPAKGMEGRYAFVFETLIHELIHKNQKNYVRLRGVTLDEGATEYLARKIVLNNIDRVVPTAPDRATSYLKRLTSRYYYSTISNYIRFHLLLNDNDPEKAYQSMEKFAKGSKAEQKKILKQFIEKYGKSGIKRLFLRAIPSYRHHEIDKLLRRSVPVDDFSLSRVFDYGKPRDIKYLNKTITDLVKIWGRVQAETQKSKRSLLRSLKDTIIKSSKKLENKLEYSAKFTENKFVDETGKEIKINPLKDKVVLPNGREISVKNYLDKYATKIKNIKIVKPITFKDVKPPSKDIASAVNKSYDNFIKSVEKTLYSSLKAENLVRKRKKEDYLTDDEIKKLVKQVVKKFEKEATINTVTPKTKKIKGEVVKREQELKQTKVNFKKFLKETLKGYVKNILMDKRVVSLERKIDSLYEELIERGVRDAYTLYQDKLKVKDGFKFYRWITQGDNKVCGVCKKLESEIDRNVLMLLNEHGIRADPRGLRLKPLGLAHINCRCVEIPEYYKIPKPMTEEEIDEELVQVRAAKGKPPPFSVSKFTDEGFIDVDFEEANEYLLPRKYYPSRINKISIAEVPLTRSFQSLLDRVKREKGYSGLYDVYYTHEKSPLLSTLRKINETIPKDKKVIIHASGSFKRIEALKRQFSGRKVAVYKSAFDVEGSLKALKDFQEGKVDTLIVVKPFHLVKKGNAYEPKVYRNMRRQKGDPKPLEADYIIDLNRDIRLTMINRKMFAKGKEYIQISGLFDKHFEKNYKYRMPLPEEIETLFRGINLDPKWSEKHYDLFKFDEKGRPRFKVLKFVFEKDVILKDNLEKLDLKRPMETEAVFHFHRAKKMHNDFRIIIGDRAISFAIPKIWVKDKPVLAIRTPDHKAWYAKVEGYIPKDTYGYGLAWVEENPRILISKFKKKYIEFRILEGKNTGLYALKHLKDDKWLLYRKKTKEDLGEIVKLENYIKRKTIDITKRDPIYFEVPKFPEIKLTEKIFKDPNWAAQVKKDGARYLMVIGKNGNRFLSRRISKQTGALVERTDNLPHLRDANFSKFEKTVIDGEVYNDKLMFQDISGILNSKPSKAIMKQKELGKLKYMPFDILYYKGIDVRNLPYEERYKLLRQIFKGKKYFHVPRNIFKNKKKYFERIVAKGGEGIMLKDMKAKYGEGVIKYKKLNTEEVIVIGATEGKGKYRGKIGALIVGMYDENGNLVRVGKVSGMSDKMRDWFTENLDKIINNLVIEVKFMEITKDLKLRAPRFYRIRDDKSPDEVKITSLKERFKIK